MHNQEKEMIVPVELTNEKGELQEAVWVASKK
jgi:hypothetical protein